MDYEQILQSIFPSPDMRDYLIEKGLDHSVSDIEDLIMRAPVPLRLKQELMEQISSAVETDDESKWCTILPGIQSIGH